MAKRRKPCKFLTPAQVSRLLCKAEGLKKQVDIAQMSEIVGAISDLLFAPETSLSIYNALYRNGRRRAIRKGKVKCAK